MSFCIAVIADVHVPECPGTAQHAAFEWAVQHLAREQPDLVVVAGDVTALGTRAAARWCRDALDRCGLPYVLTPGNAELRTPQDTCCVLGLLNTDTVVRKDDWAVVLIDSSNVAIPESERARAEEVLSELSTRVQSLMIVTHVPLDRLPDVDRAWLAATVQGLSGACLVAGHTHRDLRDRLGECSYHVVRGLDPDKAIGGPPAVAVFECRDSEWTRRDRPFPGGCVSGWDAADRREFLDNLGYSCMNDPLAGIADGIHMGVPVLEIRAESLDGVSLAALSDALRAWRSQGGRYLSLHMRNLRWDRDRHTVAGVAECARDAALACELGCDALTVHVPRISAAEMCPDGAAWSYFTDVLRSALAPVLDGGMVVSIENLHLNPGDVADGTHAFGCAPDECLAWIGHLREALTYAEIRLHLDIGHARNNGVLASRFPLGTWYAAAGTHIGGYHLHQVTQRNGRASNHTAFDGLYGPMISLASFLWAWETQQIRHAPMFLEVRAPASGPRALRTLRSALKSCQRKEARS